MLGAPAWKGALPALVACVAACAAARADDDTPPEPPKQERIDAAVARGVKWLEKERKRDGSFGQGPGETALALLTLRHSGVKEDAKVCRRAAAYLERALPDGTVYGAGLGALALLSQNAKRHDGKIRELVGELVTAQCKNCQCTDA